LNLRVGESRISLRSLATKPASLPPGASVFIAVLAAIAAGVIAATADRADLRPDVDQLWFAARALLDGRNPYDLIGPGREFDYHWQLYYPLPAVLLLTPLAPFPLVVSRISVAALGAGLLAYGIARHDARGLVVFLSRAFYVNAWYAQWTPLLVAMWYLPYLSALLAAKPTIGLVMLTGARPRNRVWRGLAVGALLTAAAFMVQPSWVQDWLAALGSNTHLRPWVTVPGGVLLLLAVLRWRRWEAWFLAAFAIVPQTFHPLATLPMILLPATLGGKAAIAALTYLPNWLLVREPFGSRLATATAEDIIAMYGIIVLWTVLVPTLFFVLRLPNRGPVPAFLDRMSGRWPAWIRGSA
jgi:hypothetical protein